MPKISSENYFQDLPGGGSGIGGELKRTLAVGREVVYGGNGSLLLGQQANSDFIDVCGILGNECLES